MKIKKEKILVTGGSGFLGYTLVEKLLKNGNHVVVFDNDFRGNFKKFKHHQKKNLKLIKGDIRNLNQLKKAIKNCYRVFHLAFINGTGNFYEKPGLVLDVGILGTINILNLCKKEKKLKFFHYASSSEVYNKPKKIPASENEFLKIPDPTNPRFSYSGSKIIGEILTFNYLRDTKIKHNIFRPHNVFGPEMGFEHVIPQIVEKIFKASNKFNLKKCSITIQGNGRETRAFCYVEDAVEQIIKISKRGKNQDIYNIGQRNEISILKLISDISKILKINVNVKKGKLLQGSPKRRCPSIKKLLKIGYKQNNNYKKGLIKSVNWYKDYYKKNIL